jgi:hypothetical protein
MVGLSPLGKLWREKMENFKTWQLTYKTTLVSTGHLNPALLHEAIAKALRNQAGAVGYLVGEEATDLSQTGGSDE